MRIIQVEVERTRQAAQFEPERLKAIAALDDDDDRARCTQTLRGWVRDQLFTPLAEVGPADLPDGDVVRAQAADAAQLTPLAARQAWFRQLSEWGGLSGTQAMGHAHYVLGGRPGYREITVPQWDRVVAYLEHWVLHWEQLHAYADAAEADLSIFLGDLFPDVPHAALTLDQLITANSKFRAYLVKHQIAAPTLTALPNGATPSALDFLDTVPATAPAAVYHQPAPIPAVASRPPQPQPAGGGGGGGGRPVPGDGAVTDKQLKAIYAIARAARHLSESEVDFRCGELYGGKTPSDLTRKEASALIDALKGETPA